MLIASILTNLVGILVFLFIFWKRLREDYSADIIFKAAFLILSGVLIGFLFSLKFFPQAFLWLAFAGGLLGLGFALFSLRVKFYETFEALIISALPWTSFVFLQNSVAASSLSSFFAFLGVLIFIFISYYLDAHYKNFNWYKSGKIGFAGTTTLSLVFVVRAVLAIFGIPVISFVSLRLEAVISSMAALICFALLFNLGRTKE